MLGGGVFVTQNKILPGFYINIVGASKATATLGERGTVAIALPLNKAPGKVILITQAEFVQNSQEILGSEYNDDSMKPLREIFQYATKCYIYDSGAANNDVSSILAALEGYDFNILCAYTSTEDEISQYIAQTKVWRDTYGKKVQTVVYNSTEPDYEGIINVVSKASDTEEEHALTAWVAGAEAGCAVNRSCTNKTYNGEYTIICDKSQTELEECISNGQFVFHTVYGDVNVLEDINSLTTISDDKTDDFKSNQTIRVVDQIANDIAKLFNTKYLGKVQNNDAGRTSLWADIVKHHRDLETLEAIQDFDPDNVTVQEGDTKKAVVVNDIINVVNAMSQVYMTLVVQ